MKRTEDRMTPDEQRVMRWVQDLPPVRPDPFFRDRLKRDFVSGAVAQGAAAAAVRTARRRAVLQFAVLSALAVGVWLLFELRGPAWRLYQVAGAGEIRVNGQAVDAGDRTRLARLLGPDARVQVSGDARLDLVAGDILLLELAPGTDMTLPGELTRWFSGPLPLEASLRRGEVHLRTGPGFSGRGFTLRTAEGLTRVAGTVLSVLETEELTCVCVLEGTARIGRDEARLEEVSAGFRKVMFRGDKPSLVTDIEPGHKAALLDFLERTQDAFH